MEFVWIYVVIMIIICIFAISVAASNKQKEDNLVDASRTVTKGMKKSEVIDILGNDYSYSCLKNGVEKYEWRYRKNGYSYRVAKGVSMRQSGYTRRFTVKFKDGVVIETSSLNMD